LTLLEECTYIHTYILPTNAPEEDPVSLVI
jgi:hypothetical protein